MRCFVLDKDNNILLPCSREQTTQRADGPRARRATAGTAGDRRLSIYQHQTNARPWCRSQ